jgi:hypothetical protein
MKRSLSIAAIVLTVVFVAAGNVHLNRPQPATPKETVVAMLEAAKARNWESAFHYVASDANLTKSDLIASLAGRDGSLRAYSSLDRVDASVLHDNGDEALVRVALRYASAVGALEDTRDLKVVRQADGWKVVWPVTKEVKVPPQVIPVNYLRWDVVYRGAQDDWGAQDAAPPKVRIISMDALDHDNGVVILGEIVNDDTVPGFISVNAALMGKDDEVLGEETAFDKVSHTLLPKEVSPFRIDFPGVRLAQVKNVRMTPNSLLVPAAADPVIGVMHQQLTADHRALTGELVNQGGQTVNIPHVLATFYDNSGKIVWVSDAYVEHVLLPETPQPFSVAIARDVALQVQTFRVTVNTFLWNQQP